MRIVGCVTCDNNYVPYAIVALKCLKSKNTEFDLAIVSKFISDEYKNLCKEYDISVYEVDLSNDFIDLDKRRYGDQYPIECFYHFYLYKILTEYDYIVHIEPDIYTNKKLDIDWSEIEYIAGGSRPSNDITNFPSIMRDITKIIKANISSNYMDFYQPRILGGPRIYNVKNCEKIKFYEVIIYYYKKSIECNCQRCGDDSLQVLYQLYNRDHFKLYDLYFNYFQSTSSDAELTKEVTDRIIFFHAGYHKYWKKRQGFYNGMDRYFTSYMIRYLYNNFDIEFIKNYFNDIYVDISQQMFFNFYYYSQDVNFGDLITPYFLSKLCKPEEYRIVYEKSKEYDFNSLTKIISCGSIMRLCSPKTIVYGSGIRDIKQNIKSGLIECVRGPLTRNRLIEINCYCPPVYGDLGLLLPKYFNPDVEIKYELGIVPHYTDYKRAKELYKDPKWLVIDLTNKNIEETIIQMKSCRKILSSSLHGLIVSDAYGIPNKWIKFDNKINGDGTKFKDYFLSVNRVDQSFIDCLGFQPITEAIVQTIPDDVSISIDLDLLSSVMFFDENGITNYTKYLYANLSKNQQTII